MLGSEKWVLFTMKLATKLPSLELKIYLNVHLSLIFDQFSEMIVGPFLV